MSGFRTLVVVLGFGMAALATTLEKQDLASVTSQADRIFTARVLSTQGAWDPADQNLFTTVELEVIEGIKNASAGQRITMRILGGTGIVPGRGAVTLTVPAVPQFEAGERVLLFAQDDPRLFVPIAGWFQGAFQVVNDPRTGQEVVADHEGHFLSVFAGNDTLVGAGEARVGLDEFTSRIRGYVAAPEESHSGQKAEIAGDDDCATPSAIDVQIPAGRQVASAPFPRESSSSRSSMILLGLALLALGCAALAWSTAQGRKAGVR